MKKKIFKITSYILILLEIWVCVFSNGFSLNALAKGKDEDEEIIEETDVKEDDISSDFDFVEGRYIREDGNVYMMVYYVDKKGATVSFFDTDIEIVWWDDYQPVQSQRVFEEELSLSKTKKSERIQNYKDNILVFPDAKKDKNLKVYISEDNKKIHIEDEREDKKIDPEKVDVRDFSGDYVWQPFIIKHTSLFEKVISGEDEIEIEWTIPGGILYESGTYWIQKYKDVYVPETRTWTVKEPDKYIHEKIKWKEKEYKISLEEIASCLYSHFTGVAVVTATEVTDDKKFRDYHLNDRLPSADGQFCADKKDEDAVIKARKDLLKNFEAANLCPFEFMFYQNTAERNHFAGLYIENGMQLGTKVPLSQGDLNIEYGLSNIEWTDNNANTQFGYIVDPNNGIIRVIAEADNVVTGTGGICDHIAYDISLYFNDDGSVEAFGTVDCYGEGSEHVTYTVMGNADDFQFSKDIECKWEFVETEGEYDIDIVIPGDEYEQSETVWVKKQVPYWEEVNWERITQLPDIKYTEKWIIYWEYRYWIAKHHIHISDWPLMPPKELKELILEEMPEGLPEGFDFDDYDFEDIDWEDYPESNPDSNHDINNQDDNNNPDSDDHGNQQDDNNNPDSDNHGNQQDDNNNPDNKPDTGNNDNKPDSDNHGNQQDDNNPDNKPDTGNNNSGNNNPDNKPDSGNGSNNGNGSSNNNDNIPAEFNFPDKPLDYNPGIPMESITKIAATSSLWNQSADNMIDGNLSSCWSEGKKGTGKGEEIIILFDETKTLSVMGIANGCFANQNAYEENGKARRLKLTFADGKSEYFDLFEGNIDVEQSPFSEFLYFENSHKSNYVRITIEDAVAGSKYEDTCISEIVFD